MTAPGTPSSSSPHGSPEGVRFEDAPCPLGCANGDEPLFSGGDKLHGLPGTFSVVRCRGCGLLRTNPRPAPESIGFYYPGTYAPYAPKPVSTGLRKTIDALLRRLRLDGTRTLVPPIAPGRALEIGCASGGFLKKLQARGWDVAGVEPSTAAAETARGLGLRVHVGPLETAPAPEAPVNLVTASHAFEHLHQPVAAFEKLRGWSTSDGWLTCAVPDASAALFSRFQTNWYDLDLPRHLFHFTPDTLTAALEKSGWRVVRVTRQATLNGVMGTLGNALTGRGWKRLGRALSAFPDASALVRESAFPLAVLAGVLGQSGRMVVWARAR
jgi:SAM-dependent methyltransferase